LRNQSKNRGALRARPCPTDAKVSPVWSLDSPKRSTNTCRIFRTSELPPVRNAPSLFDPVHGSAPDIASKVIANPTGVILAAGMMLDWLGESEAAAEISRAVEDVLTSVGLTSDLGGSLGTDAFTSKVVEA
jgi:tartrate dehydrogenase/decarboxylase/D-malate dehydrogenase